MKPFALLLSIISTFSGLLTQAPEAKAATTYLVLGSYHQSGDAKPKISKDTSPTLTVIPMESTEQCEAAGRQISEIIYKPVWYFDGRWTCVEGK